MTNKVHFYDLPATNDHKCEVMLLNKMQCTTRASVAATGMDEQPSYYCKHHFVIERALNEKEGTKYIFHASTGEVASDVDKEYKPAQK